MRLVLLAIVAAFFLWVADQTLYKSYYSHQLLLKVDRINQDLRYQIKKWF